MTTTSLLALSLRLLGTYLTHSGTNFRQGEADL